METWETLQKTILAIFEDSKTQKVSAVMEEDGNGWNWIISFDLLENPTALILHTKFIFKLDPKREKLRRQDFLWLYDLNCIYHWQKFTDMDNLTTLVKDIILNARFGENLLAISEFMVSPAAAINKYFYSNKETSISVFEVDYKPKTEVVACVRMSLDFKFSINNKQDLYVRVRQRQGRKDFDLLFAETEFAALPEEADSQNETAEATQATITIDSLTKMAATVAQYMKRNYGHAAADI